MALRKKEINNELIINNQYKWSRLIKTWFCRFYDNIFLITILNLIWFLSFILLLSIFWRFNFIIHGNRINVIGIIVFYITFSVISIGFKLGVIKIFNLEQFQWADIIRGITTYGTKALTLSILNSTIFITVAIGIKFYLKTFDSHQFISIMLISVLVWMATLWFFSLIYQLPILFFQNPPIRKILERSFFLSIANGKFTFPLGILFFVSVILFCVTMVPWFFIGFVYFISLKSVLLEKVLLQHKITYKGKPVETILETLEYENRRSIGDFIKPWENR